MKVNKWITRKFKKYCKIIPEIKSIQTLPHVKQLQLSLSLSYFSHCRSMSLCVCYIRVANFRLVLVCWFFSNSNFSNFQKKQNEKLKTRKLRKINSKILIEVTSFFRGDFELSPVSLFLFLAASLALCFFPSLFPAAAAAASNTFN